MALKDTLKKILKAALIGGGTILSLLCPPAGGAVITAGAAIGTGAIAAGELIKTNQPKNTVDNITGAINNFLINAGLMNPAGTVTPTGGKSYMILLKPVLIIAAGLVALYLIFKPRRRRRR